MLFRSLAIPAGVVLVAALMADRHDEFGVEARTPAFFRRTSSQLHQKSSAGSSKKSLLLSRSIIDTLSRGGAAPGEEKIVDDSDTTDEEADAEAEVLYLPGLLEVALTPADQPTAVSDSVIFLSAKKAKELGVSNGEVVAVIGRRRNATYGRVQVQQKAKKQKKKNVPSLSVCTISENVAKNLRLRKGDKIKIVPIGVTEKENEGSHSGDLILVETNTVPMVDSLTFSPIEDSMLALESVEGNISDEEIHERFIAPYLEVAGGLLKRGQLLILVDDSGRKLEFLVTHMTIEGDTDDEEKEKKELSEEETKEKAEATVAGELTEGTHAVVGGSAPRPAMGLGYDSVGGLESATKLMRELVELPLRFPELWTTAGVPTPKGILLHGPPGSGKTLIANALVEETGAYVVVINGPEIMASKGGESEANLRLAFEEAQQNAPAIIFMDELDSIAPKRDQAQGETEKRVVSQLLTLMDSLKTNSNVMVIGATNRPNVIESALRRPGRFDRELEIAAPDEEGRHEILKIKTKDMQLDVDVDLFQIARDTHGYVGADIQQLTLEAALQCIRSNLDTLDIDSEDPIPDEALDVLRVTNDHFNHALGTCDPSTLRDNKIEIPDVKWADIGGLEETKLELQEMVRYPIEHRHLFERFGMQASRGVLFYGPPGCGKTLMAKAIASECGANFISVKGPELLNMYFGGSEANVRNLFDKARAASPCILFFDEMDSIARARGSGGSGSSDTSDRVINQILSEIDGMGSGKTLFIIGATNRPDILDPGIMRPGRLDQLIYIPLPDRESRVSIFKANLRKSPIGDDISIDQLADATDGFSGADITEICQRAAKNAIRDSIKHGIERQKRVESGEMTQQEVDDLPDPVPAITKVHFEASMSKARRSVTPDIIAQYDEFTAKQKASWGAGGSGADENKYDIDEAARDQAREDSLLEEDDAADEVEEVEEADVEDEPVEPVPATGED